jgi:hypothetical protein
MGCHVYERLFSSFLIIQTLERHFFSFSTHFIFNVLHMSRRAHNIEMSSVQSGRAQGTHVFLGVIIRPLPIHWQISGRASQLLNWFQLMGVLNPYFGPPLKFSYELLLIQIMLHKTVQTTHHGKLLLFAFHHCKDFRGCQVEVPTSLIDHCSWKPSFDLNSQSFFLCNPNSPLSASLERQ